MLRYLSFERTRMSFRSMVCYAGALLGCLILLAACGQNNRDSSKVLGSDVTLSGSGSLTCSDPCRQRGQCGSVDTGWVVLLSRTAPKTTGHDLSMPVNASVAINQQQMVLVESISDPTQAWREPFYEIFVPELGAAWVAGWCITQEIVP